MDTDEIPGCDWPAGTDDICQSDSRFVVERAVRDPGEPPAAESCKEHLADTVMLLSAGRPVSLEVAVRWSADEKAEFAKLYGWEG